MEGQQLQLVLNLRFRPFPGQSARTRVQHVVLVLIWLRLCLCHAGWGSIHPSGRVGFLFLDPRVFIPSGP